MYKVLMANTRVEISVGSICTKTAETVTLLGMIKRQSTFTPVQTLKDFADFK